jgi:hypothetical protein
MSEHSDSRETEGPAPGTAPPRADDGESSDAPAAVADDPDALLDKWMDQIRDSERRAERETAAIRLR